MENILIGALEAQGIWTVCAVALTFYVLRTTGDRETKSLEREYKLYDLIYKLTEKFKIIEEVKKDVEEIKNKIE